jgi:hypothetical protein
MKIKIEVTQAELDEMEFESADECKERMRAQIEDGVVGTDGEAGEDWLVDFELDIVVV